MNGIRKEMPVIVIVDADKDFIKTTCGALLKKRYRLKYYSDRCAAFEGMRRSKPSLVITNVTLDEFPSDFSLPVQMKSDPNLWDVPIIIVSSVGQAFQPADQQAGEVPEAGLGQRPVSGFDISAMYADAYLDKQVSAEALLDKVEDFVAMSAKKQNPWITKIRTEVGDAQ